MATQVAPWWKGRRGEWYVIGQMTLLALVALGPRSLGGSPRWSFAGNEVVSPLSVALLLAGGWLVLGGAMTLGTRLTPLPCPRSGGSLVESGAYRVIRHPIYGGLILGAFGWGLLCRSWLTLGFAALLSVLLDRKSRREEQWLLERYPGYADYRRRVRRLIPFVY